MSKHMIRRTSLLVAAIALVAVPSMASASSHTSAVGGNWRVFNVKPATAAFWDINQAKPDGNGGVQFPVQTFDTSTTGSFAVYLSNNYNVSLTDTQTISANATWTTGLYQTRSTTFPGAYARVEFQDVASGGYTSNDYWWYSPSNLDLNAGASGTLTAPLADRGGWSNVCGQLATDTTTHAGPNCVGGTDPAVSPSDGFDKAMKNVKQVNLSFGSAGSYASGIAVTPGPASFDLTSFDIS